MGEADRPADLTAAIAKALRTVGGSLLELAGALDAQPSTVRDDEPTVIPLREAATMLGIAPGSAYRMVREETFPVPVRRVGRRLMVARHRVHAYINGAGS